MIDKTVLILANGSLPAENDEVLRSGRYDCTINSIRNYAGERTRNLKIQTLDAEGNPLADTSVGILVYNWGTLRPLIYVKTDSAGKYTLSVGRGAFYLSAFKDGKSALELVPSSEDEDLYCQLSLSEKPLAARDDMLFYPSNPFEWKQAPASWDEGVKVQKDYWAAIDRSYADRFGFGAAPKQERFIIAARGNHSQAQEFLRRHPNADENFQRRETLRNLTPNSSGRQMRIRLKPFILNGLNTMMKMRKNFWIIITQIFAPSSTPAFFMKNCPR